MGGKIWICARAGSFQALKFFMIFDFDRSGDKNLVCFLESVSFISHAILAHSGFDSSFLEILARCEMFYEIFRDPNLFPLSKWYSRENVLDHE